MILPQEIIRIKRDGGVLSSEEIRAFIHGMVTGDVIEGQVAAFGMAVLLQGMTMSECVALTQAMTYSGNTLQWDLPGPVLDKHSTGGVGDMVSLVLGPLIAACGGFVPMISGRGLGHTGGTLDKLESIPRYNAIPSNTVFRRAVREAGCAIIGQTGDLAPADGIFYAIRDVTATVESVPLITASILSKKLAAGLDGLVMDVKSGSGAFMTTVEQAVELGESIVEVARGAGLACSALVTDMDQPLASCAGNALEVLEAVRFLSGQRDPRLEEVVLALGESMLVIGDIAKDAEDARSHLLTALNSGAAAERFERMVTVLGGESDILSRGGVCLPKAPVVHDVTSPHDGILDMDCRKLGLVVVALGGGRTRATDGIDHAVGLDRIARAGTRLAKGDVLCRIHARDSETFEYAKKQVLQAVSITQDRPTMNGKPVLNRIDVS